MLKNTIKQNLNGFQKYNFHQERNHLWSTKNYQIWFLEALMSPTILKGNQIYFIQDRQYRIFINQNTHL